MSWRVPDFALGTELPGQAITGISGFLNLPLDIVPLVNQCPGLGLWCQVLVDHLYVLGLSDLTGVLDHPALCPRCSRLGLGH